MANYNNDINFKFVKECIVERLDTYGIDPRGLAGFSEQKLENILVSLLHRHSRHYYLRHVKNILVLQDNTILERLNQDILQKVWKQVEELWPCRFAVYRPLFMTGENAAYAVVCKKTEWLEGAQLERSVENHNKILKNLYRMQHVYYNEITKLLSLCLWVYFFYCKKKKKNHSNYNRISHVFHSDLVIAFIALRCRYDPPPGITGGVDGRLPELPPFNRTIVYHGISPENPVFQRLVLHQMLKIIVPGYEDINWRQRNIVAMAERIHRCLFRGDFSWSTKGIRGILSIIKDQSRYMTLRRSDMHVNYVAEKTRRELSAVTKMLIECKFKILIPSLRNIPHTVLYVFHFIREVSHLISGDDDGSLLPPIDPPPLDPPDTRPLNMLHHLILVYICKELIPGYQCPEINKDGWFIGVKQINQEIRKVANAVLLRASEIPKELRPTYLYPTLGKLAVALQHIIAARWYLCEVSQHESVTIEANKAFKTHHELVFVFLAFRAIVMFILVQNPYRYGVQQVAVKLPLYARELEFDLPLLFLTDS